MDAQQPEKTPMKRGGNRKRLVRNTLLRLGLHARPADVVRALDALGIAVGEELVRAVALELRKALDRARRQRVPKPPPAPPPRRYPRSR
jgi:hypothetical protein